MAEIELEAEKLSDDDNLTNVEMSKEEIWLLKHLINKYNPKKIVEIGISAGGNTVNLLKWKDKDAQLFSIDIAANWYKDKTKLSGFMADEVSEKNNFEIYRGYDYIDVYKEIGNDIDFIIIDTVHTMPGEFLTFLTALPQLKDGCILILHDIHLNMKKFKNNKFGPYDNAAYCTGLLYAGLSSPEKFSLKTDRISNIGALVVDESTRDNVKDIFRLLCSQWYKFPHNLNFPEYCQFINEHYPQECSQLFERCLRLHKQNFDYNRNAKKNEKTDFSNELKNKNKEIQSLRKENELIKSTVSWKVTKPLRYISKLLK